MKIDLFRVWHDGHNTTWNNPEQFRQDITDVIGTDKIENSRKEVLKFIRSQKFTGIKRIATFGRDENLMLVQTDYVINDFRVEFICKWFDMWIGVFIDKPKRIIYILPIPCIGVKISF